MARRHGKRLAEPPVRSSLSAAASRPAETAVLPVVSWCDSLCRGIQEYAAARRIVRAVSRIASIFFRSIGPGSPFDPSSSAWQLDFPSACLVDSPETRLPASLKAPETACVSNPALSIDPHSGAGVWARLGPAVVTATGPDAVRFVDNFATAGLSSLAVGAGSESFFTDVRGWVLALTTVLRTENGLVILAAPGLGPTLRDHLERYHIREAVEIADESAGQSSLLVTGQAAAEVVQQLFGAATLPARSCDHQNLQLDGVPVRVVRVTGQGADGFWVQAQPGAIEGFIARLTASNLPQADPAALESLRIEACYPTPAEILEKTLPQELGRDTLAISFKKGCYLGQETVARLDAMGHVNRRLALVAIDAAEPPPMPAVLELEGRTVATLTSACHSSQRGCLVGLGLVQTRALASPDLRVGAAAARVVVIAGDPKQLSSTAAFLQPRD